MPGCFLVLSPPNFPFLNLCFALLFVSIIKSLLIGFPSLQFRLTCLNPNSIVLFPYLKSLCGSPFQLNRILYDLFSCLTTPLPIHSLLYHHWNTLNSQNTVRCPYTPYPRFLHTALHLWYLLPISFAWLTPTHFTGFSLDITSSKKPFPNCSVWVTIELHISLKIWSPV